jgi:predicted SnoaL-like aldol condensation-catalyzing enzyme
MIMAAKRSNQSNIPAAEAADPGNVDIALQFLKDIEAGKIDETYRQFTAPGGKHHNPFYPAGFPALQKGMEASHLQFPEMRLQVKNVVAGGDLVAVHSHVVLKPGEVGYGTLHLFRIQQGRIVEMRDLSQPVPVGSSNEDGMF